MQGVTLLILFLVPWTRVTADEIQTDQASEENSQDSEAVQLFEPTSLASFLTKYGEKTGSWSVSKNEGKLDTDEVLRNLGKSYPKGSDDAFAQFKRSCKHFEKSSTEMRFAPDNVRQMKKTCKEFLSSPTQETLDRLEDLEENMASEYLCLTRGVTYGLESGCPSQLKGNRRSLHQRQQTDPHDDLPDAEKIGEFNRNLASYCAERDSYENLQNRADGHGERLAQSVMSYMDCLCDNRTDCGHLAHAAVKSFDDNFVSPVTKEMKEIFDEGQKMETEMERHKLIKDEDLVVPENITFDQAVQKMQNAKRHQQRLKRYMSFPGCSISLENKRCIGKQEFSCTYKFVKITVRLEWRWSTLSKVEFDISLCVPVVDAIIGVINKYPPLKPLMSALNIKNACVSLRRGTADFHNGILKASSGPEWSFLVVRAKYSSTFLFRFDTKKPSGFWLSSTIRQHLNKHGDKKYFQVKAVFEAEYWSWFKWRCALCKTLLDETWVI